MSSDEQKNVGMKKATIELIASRSDCSCRYILEEMYNEHEKFKKEVATLFLNSTKGRSPWKGATGCGGYKKWEAELLRMCGYEYTNGEWKELINERD